MLVFARFTLYFVILSSLIIYLFTNIKQIGEGSSALVVLGFSVLIGIFLILLELFSNRKKIYLKKSFLFLCLFFTYLIINISINKIENLKAITIGTTGGIVLFYILGSLVSINLLYIKDKILNSKQSLNFFNFFYITFSILFLTLFLEVFITFTSRLRSDLFLIADLNGMYQRPGSFLTICFFIYSFFTAFFLFVNKYVKKSSFFYLTTFVLFALYCLLTVSGALLSQMLGSNNALINLCGLLFATTIFYIFINFTKSKNLLSKIKLNLKKIFFSKLSFKFLTSIFISLFLVAVSFIGLIFLTELDLNRLRIFSFGSGEIASVNSRLVLLENFFTHFNYNPIFGNMAVDSLTTGSGSYAHSFVLSLLSHLGIIGFSLFFLYLFTAIKEMFNYSNNFYLNNTFTFFSLIVFIGIFAISTVATFFAWIPIWFLLGLIFPPIIFKERNK